MNRTSRHRAAALMLAVVLIAMVGSAVAALTILFQIDVRHTARQRDEAQLRQMLLAAVHWQDDFMTSDDAQSLPLPHSLASQSAALTTAVLSTDRADARHIQITAALPRRAQRQILTYHPRNATWHLTHIDLPRPTTAAGDKP